MSTRSLAKSSTEYWRWVRTEYQRVHPGPFSVPEFANWAVSKGLIDMPSVDPHKILIERTKKALRAARITDSQGRTVRELLPAKVPLEVDANGNILLFEVRYDHIHSMSADHALLVFDQKDENITKQRNAATRELESFLDNNPNAVGREKQFVFDFYEEQVSDQIVQTIEESPSPKLPNKPR